MSNADERKRGDAGNDAEGAAPLPSAQSAVRRRLAGAALPMREASVRLAGDADTPASCTSVETETVVDALKSLGADDQMLSAVADGRAAAVTISAAAAAGGPNDATTGTAADTAEPTASPAADTAAPPALRSVPSLGGLKLAAAAAAASPADSKLRPFVSDLALKTLGAMRGGTSQASLDITAAVLFIDISGYSGVASALASRGAYALSDAVNGYMARLLAVVAAHKGDVIKFAGDAIICTVGHGATLAHSVAAATACAVEMQEQCGRHDVPGIDKQFQIHVGITGGTVRSTVFRSCGLQSNQAAFHLIGGAPLEHTGLVVDTAKRGETGLHTSLLPALREIATVETSDTAEADVVLVTKITMKADAADESSAEASDEALTDGDDDDAGKEDPTTHFVHPLVANKLRYTEAATQLAELRFLTVLFIGMTKGTAAADVGEWFSEVLHVLDEHLCPVVQIIDDDKGVHIVAAVSLLVIDRASETTSVRIARALLARDVGVVLGAASGATFCGVMGSADACRWEITGAAAVRACRLMQKAMQDPDALPVVFDETIYDGGDKALLRAVGNISVKGSPEPVNIYTLNDADVHVLNQIESIAWLEDAAHGDHVERLRRTVVDDAASPCRAVIIHGAPETGKATVARRAVAGGSFVAITIDTVYRGPEHSVAAALAERFARSDDATIAAVAAQLQPVVARGYTLRAARLAATLCSAVVASGRRVALIVRDAQLLSDSSVTVLKHMIANTTTASDNDAAGAASSRGRFLVFLTMTPLHGVRTHTQLAAGLAPAVIDSRGSTTANIIELVSIGHVADDVMLRVVPSIDKLPVVHSMCLAAAHNANGIPGIVARRIAYLKSLRPFLAKMSEQAIIWGPRAVADRIKATPYTTVAPAMCAKLLQSFDVLPASLKFLLRVLAEAVRHDLGAVPAQLVYSVAQRFTRAIVTPAQCDRDVATLCALHLVERHPRSDGSGDEALQFVHVGLGHVLQALAVPDQRRELQAALADELPTHADASQPLFYLMLASYRANGGDAAAAPAALVEGWRLFNGNPAAVDADAADGHRLRNLFAEAFEATPPPAAASDEAADASSSPPRPTAVYPTIPDRPAIDFGLLFTKNYTPSLALGPAACDLVHLGWGVRTHYMCRAFHEAPDAAYSDALAASAARLLKQFAWIDAVVGVAVPEGPGTAGEAMDTTDAKPAGDASDEAKAAAETPGDAGATATHDAEHTHAESDGEAAAIRAWAVATEGRLDYTQSASYNQYVNTTLQARVSRCTAFAQRLHAACVGAHAATPDVFADALAALLPDHISKYAPLERTVCARALQALYADGKAPTPESFASSLLVLADNAWAPAHDRFALDKIRDRCVRSRTETLEAYALFLFWHHAMEVDASVAPVAVEAPVTHRVVPDDV